MYQAPDLIFVKDFCHIYVLQQFQTVPNYIIFAKNLLTSYLEKNSKKFEQSKTQ